MKSGQKVFLTGATGFIGRRVLKGLSESNCDITCAARQKANFGEAVNPVIGRMDAITDWSSYMDEGQILIHLAARAHIMRDEEADPLAAYRKVNVEGTLNLARHAAEAGIKRFVFISSVKVNGEQTAPGESFTAKDSPAPKDPYGISKLEAEQGLQQIALETGMEVVIIRPPLVYGPGVKGNFASMIKLVEKGLPLPFGAIDNRRSLVGLDNLVDLIITCIDHPNAANQVFLVSDGEDLSTSGLLRRVAKAMGRPSRLISVPVGLLQLGATVLGKKAVGQRLLGSLQVDISSTRERLDWTPPVSVDEGLRRCFEIHGH
jgi:nucleoside-diphosphate-sugar epimerase